MYKEIFNLSFVKFLRSMRGSVLVEFALSLPIAVALFTGIYEIATYSLLQNKMVRVGGTLGDTIAMSNISRDRLLVILDSAENISSPFSIDLNGGIVVTQIRNDGETDDPLNMKISWQEVKGNVQSKIGSPGGSPADIPNNLTLIKDETIILTHGG